jgi:ubiquinone/menaquinone biosynthesis C-methylase UbiE
MNILNAGSSLTARQQSEIDYHRDHAQRRADLARQPVSLDVVTNRRRRWWNAYWCVYDEILAVDVKGKRVLVPGAGFGEDAIRLAALGAEVYAFDISPEIIRIARARAQFCAPLAGRVVFDVMPAESLSYPDDFFDAVLFIDILHHVDIPAALREVRRVMKPGGLIFGDELYTHSLLERVRRTRIVTNWLYGRMQRWIYGTETPYITPEEHKIDEREFAEIRRIADRSRLRIRCFDFMIGRLFPSRMKAVAQIDRLILSGLGSLGLLLAGRVVFAGIVTK